MKLKRILAVLLVLVVLFVVLALVFGDDDVEEEATQSDTSSSETISDGSKADEAPAAPAKSDRDPAPDFTATLLGGETFTLSEHAGSVVLLNFWATWCGPCCNEMPAFEWLDADYGDEVCILAVNCGEPEDVVSAFIDDNSYTFPIGIDTNNAVSSLYPTDSIPFTLVIAKDGTIFKVYTGAADAQTQYNEYKSAIEAALAE